MNNPSDVVQKVRQLWNTAIDKSLDESGEKQLDSLLNANAEARAEYIALMKMHTSLIRYFSMQEPLGKTPTDVVLPGEIFPGKMNPDIKSFDDVDLAMVLALESENYHVTTNQMSQEESRGSLVFDFFRNIPGYFSSNGFLVCVVLALLLPSAFAFLLFINSLRYGSVTAPNPVVTQTIAASWGGNLDGPIRAGFVLVKGQEYTLKSGLAEVMFPNDARVTVHGPTTFAITNNDLVCLDSGRCVAYVPPAAAGFTIKANGTRIVDLGTEFGVETSSADMETSVYVFQGKVELFLENAPLVAKVELTENEGVRSSAQKGIVQSFKINKDRFIRTFSDSSPSSSFLVRNPSFEQPNLTEDEMLRPRDILYWNKGHSGDSTVGYYLWTSKDGPRDQSGVSDGNRAAALILRNGTSTKTTSKAAWIYYSLGKIRSQDVGHSLKLQADCFAKTPNQEHDSKITISFATDTSAESCGTLVGASGEINGDHVWKQQETVEGWVAITKEMVGIKLFAVIRVEDASPGSEEDVYLIDNVKLFHCAP